MKQIILSGRTGKAGELRRTQNGDPVLMSFAPLPPIEVLHDLVSYDPDSGHIVWKERPRRYFQRDGEFQRWNGRYAGAPAFACLTKGGYLSGALFKRLYQAHRIAWTIQTGVEPRLIIDHINGDRADNRFLNLREATFEQNIGNRKANAGTSSRYRGVAWCKRDKRWLAYCANVNIGRFTDEAAAAGAYNQYALIHYGVFAKLNEITGVAS